MRERAVLFGPIYQNQLIKDEGALDELGRLVEAAGGEAVGRVVQNIRKPNAATFFGSGKIEELKALCKQTKADLAVFDEELTPAQGRNIEREVGIRIIDRSELILDIFANRARTHQARLQVALAQLKYKLPRLKRMWTHLDRIKSAIGARGPGESQIESDRRLIRDKIRDYTAKLNHLTEIQERTIQTRKDFKVSLVGYTNAGKSTLMRRLTDDQNVYVADQLFATLDTLTRRLKIPDVGNCLLSDTVGFVDKLPHHLVSSFNATLSEAREADLLLHVVDASDPLLVERVQTVERVLKTLNCTDLPTLIVANKCDLQGAHLGIAELKGSYDNILPVSAATGLGCDELLEAIKSDMSSQWEEIELLLPYTEGALINKIKLEAKVLEESANNAGITIKLEMSPNLIAQWNLRDYISPASVPDSDE